MKIYNFPRKGFKNTCRTKNRKINKFKREKIHFICENNVSLAIKREIHYFYMFLRSNEYYFVRFSREFGMHFITFAAYTSHIHYIVGLIAKSRKKGINIISSIGGFPCARKINAGVLMKSNESQQRRKAFFRTAIPFHL